jgi:hypothetical protein
MSELPVTVDDLPPGGDRSRRFDLLLAILLGLAAIAAGWSAYQADLDRGDSLRQFQVANKLVAESVDAFGQGDVQRSIDEQIFIDYSKAALAGNGSAVQYLRDELSPDLRVAVRAWENSNSNAASPFAGDSPFYVQPLYAEGERLAGEAAVEFEKADDLRRNADAFTLIGVLLASALFLYGIAAVSRARKVRYGLTGVGFVIYLGAALALVGLSL